MLHPIGFRIRINRGKCGFLYTNYGMRYTVARKTNGADKRAYAIYRMGIAIDRLLAADGEGDKRNLAKWARAWGLASNAASPEHLAAHRRERLMRGRGQ